LTIVGTRNLKQPLSQQFVFILSMKKSFLSSLLIYLLAIYPNMAIGQHLFEFLNTYIDSRGSHPKTIECISRTGLNEKKLTPAQQKNLKRLAAIHTLITATAAQNTNQNPYWGIPYFWHYLKPNPRNEIILIKTGKKLGQSKPPKGFERYQTYSSVDRTPDLFWSDFASEKPKYRHPDIPEFYTFGWCSEREMAFKAWLAILGIPCNIVLSGNHVWSEVELESGSGIYLKIDNTFDGFLSIRTLHPQDTASLAKWYNKKASSPALMKKLLKIPISATRKKSLSAIDGL